MTIVKVTRAVAEACEVTAAAIRQSRGGAAWMLAAWIGWNEGLLQVHEIAAGLRPENC